MSSSSKDWTFQLFPQKYPLHVPALGFATSICSTSAANPSRLLTICVERFRSHFCLLKVNSYHMSIATVPRSGSISMVLRDCQVTCASLLPNLKQTLWVSDGCEAKWQALCKRKLRLSPNGSIFTFPCLSLIKLQAVYPNVQGILPRKPTHFEIILSILYNRVCWPLPLPKPPPLRPSL